MAPNPVDDIEKQILPLLQTLYLISSATYSYAPPHTTTTLITLITTLSTQLRSLSNLTSSTSPIPIPPETIQYVDAGRNPDIYTREFVEAVGETAEYLKGRTEAIAGFRDVLADEIGRGRPELREAAEQILRNTGAGTTEEKGD